MVNCFYGIFFSKNEGLIGFSGDIETGGDAEGDIDEEDKQPLGSAGSNNVLETGTVKRRRRRSSYSRYVSRDLLSLRIWTQETKFIL